MRLYITLCLVIIGVYAADAQLHTSVPISNQRCIQPREYSEPALVQVSSRQSGVYPAAAIRSAISRSSSTIRVQLQKEVTLASSVYERYTTRTADVKPASLAKSSVNSLTAFSFWSDTCPSYSRYYYFPRWAFWYNHRMCWVLSNWHHYRVRYNTCRSRSCSGVYTFYPWITACRQSTYKTYFYYIYCHHYGLVRRYVRLPQCCSCMRLLCRPWIHHQTQPLAG
ncbi:uncharacterized protein LOC134683831 [Mytilus trossulus]|uniref:uncharacterized protein LOC134683831 n=1 Tax=Mytilus trossulus TaxID=6551 RepID=UPI003003B9A4